MPESIPPVSDIRPWTPADEARARELLGLLSPALRDKAETYVVAAMVAFLDLRHEDATFYAAAPDLLERALAEIERLRREPNDWALDAQHAEVERDQLAAEIERLRLVVDVLATKHPDDVAAAREIALSATRRL